MRLNDHRPTMLGDRRDVLERCRHIAHTGTTCSPPPWRSSACPRWMRHFGVGPGGKQTRKAWGIQPALLGDWAKLSAHPLLSRLRGLDVSTPNAAFVPLGTGHALTVRSPLPVPAFLGGATTHGGRARTDRVNLTGPQFRVGSSDFARRPHRRTVLRAVRPVQPHPHGNRPKGTAVAAQHRITEVAGSDAARDRSSVAVAQHRRRPDTHMATQS